MLMRERRAPARGGFTLMELLVVVAIIVVLAGAAVPMFMKYLEDAKLDTAFQGAVKIAQAAEAYRLSHEGNPPESLQVLAQPDDNGHAIFELRDLKDPWGNDYHYVAQGTHGTTGKVEVWSGGPHGNAEIGSWMRSSREWRK